MEEKEQCCIFFNTCGAYIIQEKLGKNWSELYCFKDFKNCIHFEDRKKVKPFIVREKERFGKMG